MNQKSKNIYSSIFDLLNKSVIENIRNISMKESNYKIIFKELNILIDSIARYLIKKRIDIYNNNLVDFWNMVAFYLQSVTIIFSISLGYTIATYIRDAEDIVSQFLINQVSLIKSVLRYICLTQLYLIYTSIKKILLVL